MLPFCGVFPGCPGKRHREKGPQSIPLKGGVGGQPGKESLVGGHGGLGDNALDLGGKFQTTQGSLIRHPVLCSVYLVSPF